MHEAAAGVAQARLLRQVVLLHSRGRAQLCALMCMNDTDYSAVALLFRGPMSPSELSAALGLSSAATTAVVDRLAAAGHVERQPHPRDRRRTLVRLVPASKEQVRAEVEQMYSRTGSLMADFDELEAAAVLRYLERTRDALEHWHDDVATRVAERDVEAGA